jgi:hypothetical protein
MGRRSPGRSGGRAAAPDGRGRWKIGCPGTGRPGAGRPAIGRPGTGRACRLAFATGLSARGGGGGALYTGRGPVWGTIIRRGGTAGAAGRCGAGGAAGVAVACACAGGCAGGGTGATAGGTACTGGSGTTVRGTGGVTRGFAVCGAGGCSAADGALGATDGGAAGLTGTAGCCTAAGGAAADLISADGVAGAAGGGTGRFTGGAAAACCFCVISLSTSPGLEMCDKSILVLMASASSARAREVFAEPAACLSAWAWKCARTLSASSASIELEWVFFSVTPTSCRTSRIALLLTSSSLARSLIRIFIRLLCPPFVFPVKSSYQPHGSF